MSHSLPAAGTLAVADFNIYDVPELVRINRFLVELINVKNREREIRASSDFSVGDYARYTSTKTGGVVHIKVRTVNPKSLIGPKLLPDGSEDIGGAMVRVSPSLCTKTTLADAISAMKPKVVIPPPVAAYEKEDEDDEVPKAAAPAEPPPPSDPARDRPSMGGDW